MTDQPFEDLLRDQNDAARNQIIAGLHAFEPIPDEILAEMRAAPVLDVAAYWVRCAVDTFLKLGGDASQLGPYAGKAHKQSVIIPPRRWEP